MINIFAKDCLKNIFLILIKRLKLVFECVLVLIFYTKLHRNAVVHGNRLVDKRLRPTRSDRESVGNLRNCIVDLWLKMFFEPNFLDFAENLLLLMFYKF